MTTWKSAQRAAAQKIILLKNTLELLGMTQKQLGVELGISQTRISEMINWHRPIRRSVELALELLLERRGKWPISSETRQRLARRRLRP